MKNKTQQFQTESQQYHLPFLLSAVKNKKVQACYTGKDISTDGGALLLREMDDRLGLINKPLWTGSTIVFIETESLFIR